MAVIALFGIVVFVLVWFQPHKLFVDDRVEEPVPVAQSPSVSEPSSSDMVQPTEPEPVEPVEVLAGVFESLDHHTSGIVRVLQLADSRRVVRLERLDTSNGPDLYLYLTRNPAAGEEAAFDDEFVSLGRLKGNLGDQNYDLPGDVDLAALGTVVIWCDRFNSAFGAADLSTA
jgi:Electron transfer DM13